MPSNYEYPDPGGDPNFRPGPTTSWRDPFWNLRYGMGFNDRINYDLSGRGPTNRQGQDPGVRQAGNSAFLFGRTNPTIAPHVQPIINAVEALWRPPAEIDAMEEGAWRAQGGGNQTVALPVTSVGGNSGSPTPQTSVDTTETFRLPTFLNPPEPGKAPPLPPLPPILSPGAAVAGPPPAQGDSIDAVLSEFLGGRGNNTSGTAAPYGGQDFGTANPDLQGPTETNNYNGEPTGMVLPENTVDFNPTDNTGLAGSQLTPDEQRVAHSNDFNWHDLYGGAYGGSGGGNSDPFSWY